ncbi:MAG TPA: TAXI family TRAP transporter solute-binding subunit [Burkholderiales bacterium]|nr:TAXI family TRAP transporter solute-binding subunit [Burkholderiales bacterium]
MMNKEGNGASKESGAEGRLRAEQGQARKRRRMRLPGRLVAVSWRDLLVIGLPVLLITAAVAWIAVKFIRPAPPDTIVISAGARGGSNFATAEKYRKLIEAHGVKVQILESNGSLENLQRLSDPAFKVDVAFVQGGLTDGVNIAGLMSLGSMFPQPVMVYYRQVEPVERLSQLTGKRLAIGPEGSGTRALVMKLLKANAMDGEPTVLLELAGEEAADALIAGSVDAAFLSGDSATGKVMRRLRQTSGIELMSFKQANGYVRKFRFLSRLTLPEGSIDLATNFPPKNYQLIGPTVELVAREGLHPALSDLLIGAAMEVHGEPGLFRDAGEFPAPLERDFPISPDAQRYYKSGAQFMYKTLPFWLASLVDRLLVVGVPLLVLIIPATRIVPPLYRWRVRSRIYRWYGALMAIERDMHRDFTPEQREEMLKRVDEIDESVNNIKTPLSFADQLYVLRDHISMVRHRIETGTFSR